MEDKNNIVTLLESGVTYRQIAELYGMCTSTIIANIGKCEDGINRDFHDQIGRFEDGIKLYGQLHQKEERTENDSFILKTLERYLILPMVEKVYATHHLEAILNPTNSNDKLLYAVFHISPKNELKDEIIRIVISDEASDKSLLQTKLISGIIEKLKAGYYTFYMTDKAKSTMLSQLTDKEMSVINLRYLEKELTLEEVGRELGFCKEYIRQVEQSALDRIRRFTIDNPITVAENIAEREKLDSRVDRLEGILRRGYVSGVDERVRGDIQNYFMEKSDILNRQISLTNLPERAKTFCVRTNIKTVGELIDIVNIYRDTLNEERGIGKKTYNEIVKFIKEVYTI